MTSDPPPSKPRSGPKSGASAPHAEREVKLAEALRANLRRRKARPTHKDEKPDGGDSA